MRVESGGDPVPDHVSVVQHQGVVEAGDEGTRSLAQVNCVELLLIRTWTKIKHVETLVELEPGLGHQLWVAGLLHHLTHCRSRVQLPRVSDTRYYVNEIF